jgi:hypothetical protein
MSSLVHQGGTVKREAEIARGMGGGKGGAGWCVGAARGSGGGSGAARGASWGVWSRVWRNVRLRSICNRRGVGWSNRANRRTG